MAAGAVLPPSGRQRPQRLHPVDVHESLMATGEKLPSETVYRGAGEESGGATDSEEEPPSPNIGRRRPVDECSAQKASTPVNAHPAEEEEVFAVPRQETDLLRLLHLWTLSLQRALPHGLHPLPQLNAPTQAPVDFYHDINPSMHRCLDPPLFHKWVKMTCIKTSVSCHVVTLKVIISLLFDFLLE